MKPFWGTHETIRKHTGRRSPVKKVAAKSRQEAHMNHSIHSADRATHLKIVTVALLAGFAVAAVGITARGSVDYTQTAHSGNFIKAGKPVVMTSSETSMVR